VEHKLKTFNSVYSALTNKKVEVCSQLVPFSLLCWTALSSCGGCFQFLFPLGDE
jgi:hypothetical protein